MRFFIFAKDITLNIAFYKTFGIPNSDINIKLVIVFNLPNSLLLHSTA